MKTFTFNAWVVAGFTPISRGSALDYYINRPQGMKGYIINLTRARRCQNGEDRSALAKTNFCCSRPALRIITDVITQRALGSSVDLLYPRPYWIDWLKWDKMPHGIGKTPSTIAEQSQLLRDLFAEVIRHHSAQAPSLKRWP
jgi:AraC family transcriptional regulator of arabinose operon